AEVAAHECGAGACNLQLHVIGLGCPHAGNQEAARLSRRRDRIPGRVAPIRGIRAKFHAGLSLAGRRELHLGHQWVVSGGNGNLQYSWIDHAACDQEGTGQRDPPPTDRFPYRARPHFLKLRTREEYTSSPRELCLSSSCEL